MAKFNHQQQNKTATATPEAQENSVTVTNTLIDPSELKQVTDVTITELSNTSDSTEPKPAVTLSSTSVPEAVSKEAPPPVVNDFASYIANVKVIGSHRSRSFIQQMETYIANMQPGRIISNEEGASHQHSLWRLIKSTLENTTVNEFESSYAMLLGFAFANRSGVFHDRYIFRFSEYFTFNQDEVQAFQAILNLINITCVPGDVKTLLRQVDLRRTLSTYFDEETRQRVIGFYSK